MAAPDFATTVLFLREAIKSNPDALNELFRRSLPTVRRIVSLRLRRPLHQCAAEIDDVVQEALTAAFTGFHRFRGDSEGAFRAWLATIVENEIHDLGRRSRAQKRGGGKVRVLSDLASTHSSSTTGSIPLPSRDPSPTQQVRAGELQQRIEAAMLELGSRHRRILELKDLCEMSHAEIARELGLPSEEASRALYMRAHRKLQERLAGD